MKIPNSLFFFRLFCIFFLFLILQLSILATDASAVPPGEKWFTLSTKNFRIHYTAPQKNFSKAFASALEYFFPLLTKDLAWQPPTPIDIIVNDSSDISNGYAQSFPSTRMEVFPVPFEPESSLMDYYNWVEELAVHELTHIIANDSATGFYRPLSAIFGTAIRPNGLQPGWIVEGLAVFEETRLTPMGRGRSALMEALLRTAVQENKLGSEDYLSLDRLNDGVFWWPEGNTRYLLGYAIQAALEPMRSKIKEYPKYSNKEQSIPGLVSIANSHSFPYAVHDNLQDFMGFDWEEQWNTLLEKVKKRYSAPTESTPESTQACQLTNGGKFTGAAIIGNNGDIFFHAEYPNTGRVIARLPHDASCLSKEAMKKNSVATPEILIRNIAKNSPVKFALSPDGDRILYPMVSKGKGGKDLFDLYLFSLSKRTRERLTYQARARDPLFLDEQNILFIQNSGDSTQSLEKMNLQDKSQTTLFRGKIFERLSSPTSYKKNIYFSRHNNRGQEEIMKVISPEKAIAVIPNFGKGTLFTERNPIFHSDGTLYFSATYHYERPSASGVRADIYRWQEGNQRPEKIIDSKNGSGLSIWPAIDSSARNNKKFIFASTYTNTGFNLFRYPLHSARSSAAESAGAIGNDLQSYLTEKKHNSVAISQIEVPEVEEKSSEYNTFSSPATSLWPQYWIPLYQSVTDGSLYGATTSGNDPLFYHRYSLLGYYDTRSRFPIYSVSYNNSSYPWGVGLQAEQANNYFSSSGTSNRYNLYSIQSSTNFFGIRFAIGAAFQERRLGSLIRQNPFVYNRIQYGRPETANALAIAPNRGYTIANYFAYFPSKQNEINFVDERPSVSFFAPGILASHSTNLSANLALSTNRFLASSYFLGGGTSDGISTNNSYLVRGYPEDTLFGKKIFTLNSSYTLPLAVIYRGWNIYPIFVRNIGLRFLGDVGTSQNISVYEGSAFLRYGTYKFGKKFIGGIGAEFLVNTTLFYYVPSEIALGLHYGLQKNAGGETKFYLAFNSSYLQR